MASPDRLRRPTYRDLIVRPGVELIGVEPYHSFLFLADLPRFVTRMRAFQDLLEEEE